MPHTNIENNGRVERQNDEQGLGIRKLLDTVRGNWPWFAGCVIVSCTLAFLYLRYSTPSYKIQSKILVQDERKGGSMPDGQLLQDMGLLNGKSNVDNEVEILKSRTLMERVVRDLQLNVRYFSAGRIKTMEQYGHLPFRLRFTGLNEDSIKKHSEYSLLLKGEEGFELTGSRKRWIGKWNSTLQLPVGSLFVERTTLAVTDGVKEFKIRISGTDAVVTKYMDALSVAVANKQVSAINLILKEEVPEKGEEILNKLIEVYLRANLEDKSRIADSTIRFINERLALVGDDLSGIEHQIESFKMANKLTDLSEQSKLLLSNTSDYQRELTEHEVKLDVINSLEHYLRSNSNNRRIVPASLLIQDAGFTGLIGKYNTLQMERDKLLMSNTESNPLVVNIDQQLNNMEADLGNNIASLKRELQIGIRNLRQRSGGLDAQIRQVPGKERVFLDYSRQQNIKNELFTFLLKKREETAITKSSTIANARIIDPARSDVAPYKPRKSMTMLSALILGLLIPAAFIYIRRLLNTRVHSPNDIKEQTYMPILAEIGHNTNNSFIAIHKGSRTMLAEQFRSMRTNIQFLLKGGQNKVILVTSSVSGEGKSFVSLNLAISLALTGKRVVFIEMDLRKNSVNPEVKLNYQQGFSTYAIGQSSLADIIQPSGIQDNLFIISSGPVPPNPSELLMGDEVTELFDFLKEQFDYIVVDTAPVGLVTDAQLLSTQASVSLYIVRQGYTFKQQVQRADDLFLDKKMPKLNVVINDVKSADYGYYGYQAYYGYYQNDATPDTHKNLVTRFVKKLLPKA